MPLAESIMLFYCEVFPMSFQFAGCALIWQQMATTEVFCPMKNWTRVKVRNKRVVISYTRPPSAIAIIARIIFLIFSVQSYCSYSLHLPGHRHADWQNIFALCYLYICGHLFQAICFYCRQQTIAVPCEALGVFMFANDSG